MDFVSDSMFQIVGHLPLNVDVLAQTVTDPNIVGQMQQTWNNFVKSGQIWAFLIGVGVSYLFLKLTKFG